MGKQNDGDLKFDTRIDKKGFEKDVKSLEKMSTTAFTAIGAAAVAGFGAAIKVGGDFEEAMSSVSAISMATAEEYEMLSNAAREMGETTKFSATQCANALEYLSLAGYSAKESVEALPYVLNLAAAGGMDLAYASDLLTDSMAVMGLGISDMGNFSDQLAMAASKANTSVQQLGEAVLVAGGQAKLARMSTDQMNTALSILADKGIKGSEGGTALRNVLKNLYTPTSAAAKVMKSLGIETSDANGNLIKAQDVLKQLKSKLDSLSEADKMTAMGDIFDTRTIAAANALLDDCGDRWDELTGYLNNCDGAASDMAKTMNDNLKGDLTILGSAAEGLGITFYETFSGKARGAVQDATKAVGALTELIKSGKLAEPLKLAASGMTTFCAAIAIFKGLQAYEHLQKTISGIKSYISAVKLATESQKAMNASLLTNPYVLTLAAVTALTAGLIVYAKMHAKSSDSVTAKIAEETKALKEEREEREKAHKAAVDAAADSLLQVDYAERLIKQLGDLVDTNGEVKESDKARADFILNELNSALGTEYKSISDIIDANGNLCKSVSDVIEAKKNEILFAAYEEEYKKAIVGSKDALVDYVQTLNRIKEIRQRLKDIQSYKPDSNTRDEINELTKELFGLEKQLPLVKEKYEDFNKTISTIDAAQAAESITESNKILQDGLSELSNEYDKAIADAKGNSEKEQEIFLDTVNKAISTLNMMYDDMSSGTKQWSEKELSDMESYLNGIIEKGQQSGNDTVIALANSIKAQIEQEKEGVKSSGEELGNNIVEGIGDSIKLTDSIKTKISTLANNVVSWFRSKSGFDSNSPSKKVRDKVGVEIPEGVAAGIIKGEPVAIKAAQKVTKDVLETSKKGIEKASDASVKAFQSMLEKLQYQRDLDIINDDEYYTELEKLRDKYFKVGTSEWLRYTKEIYKYQKSAVEAEKREIEKLYDDISGYASKKIDEVLSKQDKFASKLKSYTHLFNSNTISLGDTEFSYYSMHDLHKDTEAITSYVDGLDSLNARLKELGVSGDVVKEFMSELSDMSIEEGAGFTKTLLNANDPDLLKYINAYSDNRAAIKGLSSRFYQDDMDEAWDDSIKNMVEKLQEAGYEIPEGFFTSGTVSAEKFGEAFTAEIDNQLSAVREKVEGFYAAISKMFGMSFELSAAGGGGNTYSSTYYIQPNDSSTSAQLAAIRAEERLNKLRGGYK